MKWELILAVAALIIGIFNRPLEVLWDKIFENKSAIGKVFNNIIHFLLKYGLGILGLILVNISYSLNKQYVLLTALNLFAIIMTFTTDLFIKNSKKIKALEEKINELNQSFEDKDKVKVEAGDYNIYIHKTSDYNGE